MRKLSDKKDNIVIEIMPYIHHFPPKQFNEVFDGFAENDNSSMEKMLIILNTILREDWIKTTYEKRREAFDFFIKAIKEDRHEVKYTAPITWDNDELYIFDLYIKFLSQIKRKIEYYASLDNINYDEMESKVIKQINKRIKEMEDSLIKPNHSKLFIDDTKKLIEKAKENRKLYGLIEGNLFLNYLAKFKFFLGGIKDTYLKAISITKFEKEDDKNNFEYFMLFISNYNFESITRLKYLVWKSSFEDSGSYNKMALIQQYKKKDPFMKIIVDQDNKLTITAGNMKDIVIENYDDYELENLLTDICNNLKFNEVKALEYVKITKIKNHLYINKIFNNWFSFIITIFNRPVISSLYKTLFKDQDQSLLEQNELDVVFKNITFYSFDTDSAGSTNRETMKIYEYANYTNLIDQYDKDLINEEVIKVIFLAFNLVTNEHEVLGHFNIGYQKYSFGENESDSKYDSPKISKDLSSDYAKTRKDKESGEYIEINLYGRVIADLTLKEALFILNPTNYFKNDYCSFREAFMKCNEKKIDIDEVFSDFLENSLSIKPEKLLNAENKKYSLNDLIKKSTNNKKRFSMKRKHPIGYNIDGLQEKDYDYINKLIERIKSLDEPINNSNDNNSGK